MGKAFKILSIDGGGIKGLYSACILNRLEEKFEKLSGECFDMICGTSTGGLLALGIADGKPASELVKLYLQNGNKIFPTPENAFLRWLDRKFAQPLKQTLFWGKFDSNALRKILEDAYGSTTLGELKNLVIVPSFNLTAGKPRIFKYPHKEGDFFMDRDITLVDAALATTAAPTFLPIHDIGGTLYIDGGMWANNPSLCGVLEAINFFVGEEKEYSSVEVLSIASVVQSSGWSSNVRKRRSFIGWKEKLIQTSLDSQAYFTDFFLRTALSKLNKESRYIRIESPSLSKDQMNVLEMDRTDKKALQTLKALGDHEGYTSANNHEIKEFYENLGTYKPS